VTPDSMFVVVCRFFVRRFSVNTKMLNHHAKGIVIDIARPAGA
jgi:hypothetical protein